MISTDITNRNRVKATVFLLVFFFMSLLCFAEENENDSIETKPVYLEQYQSDSSVKLFTSSRFSAFSFEPADEDERFNYLPNTQAKIGVGASWKGLSLSWGYGIDVMGNKEKGDTRSFDLQFNFQGKFFLLEASASQHAGFYLIEESEDSYKLFESTLLRPDIELRKYQLFGQYIFNGDKFSYRAPFGQKERQLISAGSLQLGFGFYFTEAKADSSFYPVNTVSEKQYLRYAFLGPNIGYTYTWVWNRIFLTASMTAGLNIGLSYNDETKRQREFAPSIYPRFYCGYNADKWSLNFQLDNNMFYISSKDEARIGMNTGHAGLTFVRRLNLGFRPKFFDKINPKILKLTGFD